MRFVETALRGVWMIEPELLTDDRGWFARTFDVTEFEAHGLETTVVQCNASFNDRRDTVRGMHYQAEPHGEAKLVRCVKGAIFDVALDLRLDSASYCRWHGVELSAENHRMLYLPRGVAHGFQTFENECEVVYQMSHEYVREAARGVRWDDPAFAIAWPEPGGERTISDTDLAFPLFDLRTA